MEFLCHLITFRIVKCCKLFTLFCAKSRIGVRDAILIPTFPIWLINGTFEGLRLLSRFKSCAAEVIHVLISVEIFFMQCDWIWQRFFECVLVFKHRSHQSICHLGRPFSVGISICPYFFKFFSSDETDSTFFVRNHATSVKWILSGAFEL